MSAIAFGRDDRRRRGWILLIAAVVAAAVAVGLVAITSNSPKPLITTGPRSSWRRSLAP